MRRTDTHQYQKPSTEPPKIHNGISATLTDKVIWIGASTADPVWQRSEDISGDNEEGEVLVEQGARKNDEEKAYC